MRGDRSGQQNGSLVRSSRVGEGEQTADCVNETATARGATIWGRSFLEVGSNRDKRVGVDDSRDWAFGSPVDGLILPHQRHRIKPQAWIAMMMGSKIETTARSSGKKQER